MSVALCPMPKMQFFDNNGKPLAGGYLYCYQPGQPGTFKATYTDSTGNTQNTNPILLDVAGRASVWLNGSYYMELWTGDKTVAGSTLIYSQDGVSATDSGTTTSIPWVDASSYGSFEEAIASIGDTVTTLVVSTAQTVSNNLQIKSTTSLNILNTGLITVASGKTLTINGPFSAGLYQVFSGTGTVTFGSTSAVAEVYPEWWGAASNTDSTASIQKCLNSGAKVVAINNNYTVSSVSVPDDTTVKIEHCTLTKTGTSAMFVVGNNCNIIGDKCVIEGDTLIADCIVMPEKTNVSIKGLTIHNFSGKSIATYTSASNITIENNHIYCDIPQSTGQGISIEYTNGAFISGNLINGTFHGIQYWGGDSNTSSGVWGVNDVIITNNQVFNVMGGIWGSCGKNIIISNNYVENCSDVGIDVEGSTNCTITGNVATECSNGCYAVFFGSNYCSFIGNIGKNATKAGSGFYAVANTIFANEYITIKDNIFDIISGFGVYAMLPEASGVKHPNKSLSNSDISGNTLIARGGTAGVYIRPNVNLKINNNTIITIASATGIVLEGSSFCFVENNYMNGYSDTSSDPVTSGGIRLAYFDVYPAQSNIVKNNRIADYNYSVVDYCPAHSTSSFNEISHNRLISVYRSSGAGYNGYIADNRDRFEPLVTISETTF